MGDLYGRGASVTSSVIGKAGRPWKLYVASAASVQYTVPTGYDLVIAGAASHSAGSLTFAPYPVVGTAIQLANTDAIAAGAVFTLPQPIVVAEGQSFQISGGGGSDGGVYGYEVKR